MAIARKRSGPPVPVVTEHPRLAMPGFIDFHGYLAGGADSAQAAYEKAATSAGVMSARQAVPGTVAASLPIGLRPPATGASRSSW